VAIDSFRPDGSVKATGTLGIPGEIPAPGGEATPCRCKAFSLLELLVVVGVLAMLMSILVPSLSSARQSARAVTCCSQLRSLAQAALDYALDHADAIPGSPLTSGRHFTETPGLEVWKPGDSVSDWYDFSGAVFSRLAGHIPQERPALVSRLTQGIFECPSNQESYGPYPQDQNYPVIRAVSYLTMNTFMRAGSESYRRYLLHPPSGISTEEVWKVAWPEDYDVVMPDRYLPRFESVGQASLKVLLADGFRFFSPPSTKDYCIWEKAFAGMQSAQPPCDIESREYGEAKGASLSYRHGRQDAINAAFFDGHAETLKKTESHRPEHYFPTGSVVREQGGFYADWQRGNDLVLP
jgi:prepilin-type N-terminal cleavage/methylation domain-containing protein/prepilin-type processing-associated H-X9-DG protein